MDRVMSGICGSSGGVLGLDNVPESEVSSVDACVAGGCRNWVRVGVTLRRVGSWSAV